MSEWGYTELGKISLKIGSGATPRGGSNSYKESGISLIRSQNVLDFQFTTSGLAFIDDEQADSLSNVEVLPKDVLLNITGDSVARSCIVPSFVLPARVNQHVAIIRPDEKLADYRFVFYQLQALKDELLMQSEIGATRRALTKGMIETLEISYPPLPEQKAIAAVLSSLDDKIDLLQRQNATLEAMAQTLFRQWFIERSPELVEGEAEDDWEDGLIQDLIELQPGFSFKSKTFVETGKFRVITIKNVQDGFLDLSRTSYLNTVPEKMPNYCHLQTADILLSLTGNVGRCCLVSNSNLLLNQRVAKLYPRNSRDWAFTYLLFRQNQMNKKLISLARGTAQLNLSLRETSNMEMLIPDAKTLEDFSETTNPLLKKVLANKDQIRTLEKLRDTLLPKLMSGEVRVNCVEGDKK
jgi:type I restriction enzyme, S subunit